MSNNKKGWVLWINSESTDDRANQMRSFITTSSLIGLPAADQRCVAGIICASALNEMPIIFSKKGVI